MNSKISGTRKIEDRLSTLPDGVVAHILSFLPTKFAATTSVLSKRWRFLFHSVSKIDLEESPLPSPRLRSLFRKFLNRLLITSEPSHLHKFRLKCRYVLEVDPINDWIRAAISRHVQQLDISVSLRRFMKLPTDIYYSKTLNSLTLRGDFIFHVPSSVQMPNLMTLHLDLVIFADVSCFRTAFPALKHLRLSDCKVDGDQVIEIVSPSLMNLILHRHFTGFKVSLNTPNLECFEYSAYVAEFVEFKKTMSCLARADIDFEVAMLAETAISYGQYAKKLIKEIQNVRALTLSGASLKALYDSPSSWLTFHNLIALKLGVNYRVGWEILAKLLESSPNLEVLDFHQGFTDRSYNKLEFEYSIPETLPVCLSKHIRLIKIGDFCGKECEFQLVEYFLRSGEALEKIRIRSLTFWNWPSSFCERLLAYPRCSKTCKIIVAWKNDENFCKRILN